MCCRWYRELISVKTDYQMKTANNSVFLLNGFWVPTVSENKMGIGKMGCGNVSRNQSVFDIIVRQGSLHAYNNSQQDRFEYIHVSRRIYTVENSQNALREYVFGPFKKIILLESLAMEVEQMTLFSPEQTLSRLSKIQSRER